MNTSNIPYQSKSYFHTTQQRGIYALIVFVALTVTLFSSFKLLKTKNKIADDPSKEFAQFEAKETQFSLVNIRKVYWTGGGAFAVVDSGQNKGHYSYASIIKEKSIDKSAGQFWGTACALAFDIETRSDIEWVSIDEVRVRILEYHELPKYEPIFPAPFEDAVVYYVELDDPKAAKTNVFASKFLVEKGVRKTLGTIRLKKGNPENFVVRVNARKPGIYILQCELLVRDNQKEEVVTLTKRANWLFDGQY